MIRLAILAIAAAAATGAAAQAQAPTNWPQIGSFTNTGTTEGNFEGSTQTIGSYDYVVTIYWLDDGGYTGADWYRVDQQITSNVDKFRNGTNICGRWTDKVNGGFGLATTGGKIFDYGPPTDHQTVNSGTGVYWVATKGPAALTNVIPKYSIFQALEDATFTATEDSAQGTLRWKTELKGCRGPRYVGTSKAAKTTFTLTTSVMVEVPEGQPLKFQTFLDSTTMSEILLAKYKENGNSQTLRGSYYGFNRGFTCDRPSEANGNQGQCTSVRDKIVR